MFKVTSFSKGGEEWSRGPLREGKRKETCTEERASKGLSQNGKGTIVIYVPLSYDRMSYDHMIICSYDYVL